MEIIHDDIYFEEIAEDYGENDAITPAEEGFMQGYLAACQKCFGEKKNLQIGKIINPGLISWKKN